MRPLGAIFYTKGRSANRAEQTLVKGEGGTKDWNGFVLASLGELLDKVDAHSSGQKK